MNENMADDEDKNNGNLSSNSKDDENGNPKRIKTDNSCNPEHQNIENEIEDHFSDAEVKKWILLQDTDTQTQSPSTSTCEELEASSSLGNYSSSTFPKLRARNRNYRRSRTDDASHESGQDDVDSGGDAAADTNTPRPSEDNQEEENSRELFDVAAESETINTLSTNSPTSPDTESESDSEFEESPILNKQKPKHNWFVVPELINRQIGCSANLQSRELFQRRCYGSLRSVQRLELMYKLEEHEGCVNSLNFHHDGTLLASGADDLKIVIWDWKLGKCLLKYKTKHRGNVFQSKFLQLNGDIHIASCARDGQVRIAQISRQEGVRDNRLLGSHSAPCHKLIVLPEQPHIILSAGEDGLVINHDVRCPKSHKIVNVKQGGRNVALYSIHGHPLKTHEFCISGRDELVRIYDQRNTNSPASILSPFSEQITQNDYMGYHVTCAVYNHDGSEILASYSDADIYLLDVNAPMGRHLHKYQGHRNGATIKGVNFFGPKSEFIISGSDCGHIYFWERNSEAIVQWILADDNGVVNSLEPHPQLPFLCTSGLDWDVKVWVPSCENEPTMKKLADTVKNNFNLRINWSLSNEGNESQMLWMLWRHLRNTNRMRRAMSTLNSDNFLLRVNSSSSSSSSSTSERSSIEVIEGIEEADGPGCAPS